MALENPETNHHNNPQCKPNAKIHEGSQGRGVLDNEALRGVQALLAFRVSSTQNIFARGWLFLTHAGQCNDSNEMAHTLLDACFLRLGCIQSSIVKQFFTGVAFTG